MRKEIKIASGVGFIGLVALAVIGLQINRSGSSPETDETDTKKIAQTPHDKDHADTWSDVLHEPDERDEIASPPPLIPEREPRRGDRPPTDMTRADDSPRHALPPTEDVGVEGATPDSADEMAPAEEPALAEDEASEENTTKPSTGLRTPVVTPPSDRFTRTPPTTPPTGLVVTSQPAVRLREYVIKPNDTLSAVAARYYGHAKYANELIKANPGIKPRQLQVGMKINIPELATTTAPAGQASPAVTVAPRRIVTDTLPPIPPERAYRVQPGEGWYELAARFLGNGNDWPELYEENKGRVPHNPRDLRAGTLIQLPERAVKNKTD